MRLLSLISILMLLFLSSCDPKVDQRAERYDPSDCPTCVEGVCPHCHGDKECAQCDGKGTRITSTKNYTGEGIKLVDTPEPCPFCKGTKLCSYCEGSGKCYQCDGEGKSDEWEKSKKKYTSKKEDK